MKILPGRKMEPDKGDQAMGWRKQNIKDIIEK